MYFAIVGEKPSKAEMLSKNLKTYAAKAQIPATVDRVDDTVMFLARYSPVYDCVFLNIELPNGVETAASLRKTDPYVSLVLLADTARHALSGYAFEAADFFAGAVTYAYFAAAMDRIVKRIRRDDEKVFLKTQAGIRGVRLSSVIYVEVRDHQTTYHTVDGDVLVWGTLNAQEIKLPSDMFVRCNGSFIVNKRYVESMKDGVVYLVGDSRAAIHISRSKRREFIKFLVK